VTPVTAEAVWPKRDDDGRVLVAARFTVVDRAEFERRVNEWMTGWADRKRELGFDPLNDLARLPYTDAADDRTVDIVFAGQPASRLWKDWLVDVTRDVKALVPSARFEAFVDRVSGVVRPA
jgi:hypothetical protein